MEKITYKGAQKVKLLIEQLTEQLKNTTTELKRAKEFGDLSENSEFSTAIDARAELEREIASLDKYIRHVVVVTSHDDVDSNKVEFGATVELEDVNRKIVSYTLVGLYEADLDQKTIYYKTPLALQLMNKKVGDTVSLNLDSVYKYTIRSINYSYLK